MPITTTRDVAEPRDVQLGPSGFFKFHNNRRGLKLGTYFWPVESPRALLLLIHGHGVHTQFAYLKQVAPGEVGKYEGSWVEALNKAGYSVCAVDNQSCGRSEGVGQLRGYFESFDDVVNDTVDFISVVKSGSEPNLSGLKTFLVGGSAGGCCAVHVAHRNPEVCDGVVLLAPMLSLERVSREGMNKYLKPMVSVVSMLTPTLAVASTLKNEMFPDIQEMYDQDPFCYHGKTRVRVAAEFLKAANWVVDEMGNMRFPFLCVHSQDDTMCDLEGSKSLFEKSKAEDKSLEIVKEMWHLLVHEPGQENVLKMVLDWLKDRS